MLSELGHDVTGVDFSDEMLGAARRNAKTYGLDVDFKKGDAESLPFENSTFDAVVNRYVLWTVPGPERALKEWTRVLKPGGTGRYRWTATGTATRDPSRGWRGMHYLWRLWP